MATIYITKGVTDLTGLAAGNDGDTLIVGEGNQTVSGTLSKWASLSGGGAGADGFDQVWIKPAFTGTLGTPTENLRFDVAYGASSVFIYQASGGSLYYAPFDTDVDTCDRFRNIGQGRVYFSGGGGTVTNYEQGPGATGFFNGSVIVLNLDIDGGLCTLLNHATDITALRIAGPSTVNCERDIDDLWMGSGATLNVYRQDSNSTKPTIDSVAYLYGGRFNWKGGNIAGLIAKGDTTLDFSGVTEAITVNAGGSSVCRISKQVLDRSRGMLNPAKVTLTGLVVTSGEADSAAV